MRKSPSRQEIQDMTPAQRSAWLNGEYFRGSGEKLLTTQDAEEYAKQAATMDSAPVVIHNLRKRAERAELRAKRWLRKVGAIEDAIVHLHRTRLSVDGVERCDECGTIAPCRTILALHEATS